MTPPCLWGPCARHIATWSMLKWLLSFHGQRLGYDKGWRREEGGVQLGRELKRSGLFLFPSATWHQWPHYPQSCSVPMCAPHCGWALQAGSVSALLPACLHGEPQLTVLTSIFKWDAAGGPGSMQGGVLCQAGSCLL